MGGSLCLIGTCYRSRERKAMKVVVMINMVL